MISSCLYPRLQLLHQLLQTRRNLVYAFQPVPHLRDVNDVQLGLGHAEMEVNAVRVQCGNHNERRVYCSDLDSNALAAVPIAVNYSSEAGLYIDGFSGFTGQCPVLGCVLDARLPLNHSGCRPKGRCSHTSQFLYDRHHDAPGQLVAPEPLA